MRFMNIFLSGVVGLVGVLLVLSGGVAQATPCNGTDMSGMWKDTQGGAVYAVSQNGCDSIHFSGAPGSFAPATIGNVVITLGSGTSHLDTNFLNTAGRSYNFANAVSLTASRPDQGLISINFDASRGRRAHALGSATVMKSSRYMEGYTPRFYFNCPRGQIFKAESLVVSGSVTSTSGGYESILDDARRILRDRGVPRSEISRLVPTQVRGLSGSRVLVKIGGQAGNYHSEPVGQCVSAAEARADEARRSSGAAPAAASAKE